MGKRKTSDSKIHRPSPFLTPFSFLNQTVLNAFLCMTILCITCAQADSLKPLVLEKSEVLPEESSVTDYDPAKGTVQLKSGNTVTNVPFDAFGVMTQQKITAWATDKAFLSSYDLLVSFGKEEKEASVHKWLDGVTYRIGRGSRICYTITVENRSPMAMHNIEAEYKIFYTYEIEIEVHRKNKPFQPTFLKKSCCGTLYLDLLPGEKITLSATPVYDLESKQVNYTGGSVEEVLRCTYSDSGRPVKKTVYPSLLSFTVREHAEGVVWRLRKPSYNGSDVVREGSDGSVPKEKEWSNWTTGKITQPENAVQSIYNTTANRSISVMERQLTNQLFYSKTDLKTQDPETALQNNYLYYRYINDRQQQIYWADKIRELAEKHPNKKGRFRPSELLEQLENMEAGADYTWGDYVSKNDETDPAIKNQESDTSGKRKGAAQ